MAKFTIRWMVYEHEWAVAREISAKGRPQPYEDSDLVVYDELLLGRLWFGDGGVVLERFDPSDPALQPPLARGSGSRPQEQSYFVSGFPLRILDFALQFSAMLDEKSFLDGLEGQSFHDSLGPLWIFFQPQADQVFIYSNADPDLRERIEADEFFRAGREFLSEVTAEIKINAPRLLDWPSMTPLSKFALGL